MQMVKVRAIEQHEEPQSSGSGAHLGEMEEEVKVMTEIQVDSLVEPGGGPLQEVWESGTRSC